MSELLNDVAKKELLDNKFREHTEDLIKHYYRQMDDFLVAYKGKILETDVLLFISKLINSLSTAMFLSFKEYLPGAPIRYDELADTLARGIKKSVIQAIDKELK